MGISSTVRIVDSYYGKVIEETSQTSTFWIAFGPAYRPINTMLDAMEEYTGEFHSSLYLPLALSTAVGAGTLLSVLVLFVISALKYGAHFKNPSVKYEKYAVAAIVTFIAGSLAFFAINRVSMSHITDIISSSSIGFDIEITLNKPTKTAMILAGVLLGVYFVLRAASTGKALADKGAIPHLVFTVCSLIFTAIALSFVVEVTMQIANWQNVSAQLGSAQLNFQALSVFLATLEQQLAQQKPPVEAEGFSASYALSVAEQFLQIGVIVAIAVVLIQKLSRYPDRKRTGMIESIVLLVIALIYFILAYACVSQVNQYLNALADNETTQDYLVLLAGPIAVLVTTVLNAVVSVLDKVILSWDRLTGKKEIAREETAAPEIAEEPAAEEIAPPCD